MILFVFLITLSLPILTHLYFYRSAARIPLTPAFLLLGPSDSGKTSFLTLLQRRSTSDSPEASPTRISQTPSQAKLLLPATIPLGSNKYRSKNDSEIRELKTTTKYEMVDTPGHGKLRSEQALSFLDNPALRGIIFVVDAASLDSSEQSTLRDTATYLHDTLLAIQRLQRSKGKSKKTIVQMLIAANKQDLFTALPPGTVRSLLEKEVNGVKESRNRGLVAVDQDQNADDAEEDVLGGGGEDKFTFKDFQEDYDIEINVLPGSVRGEEAGKGIHRWEEWIGSCL